MGVHIIPCVIYVRDAPSRKAAFERVKAAIDPNSAFIERTGRGRPRNTPMSVEYPNDEPDGAWHLRWHRGYPPEDLGDGMFYDPTTHAIGQHEEETE